MDAQSKGMYEYLGCYHTLRCDSSVIKMTPVGFEPTPFRNGALNHRLRPLGQSVSGKSTMLVGLVKNLAFSTRPTKRHGGKDRYHIPKVWEIGWEGGEGVGEKSKFGKKS